jgi:hypothetical protein
MRRFSFGSAIVASILATIVMTAFMMYFGMNTMQNLGSLAGMTGSMGYVVGGFIHFLVGIIYGLIYALFFKPWMQKIPGFLSGSLYSLLPFVLAITFMGQFQAIIKSVFHVDNMVTQTCTPSNASSTQMGGCPCPTQQECMPAPMQKNSAPAQKPAPMKNGAATPSQKPAQSPSPQTRPCAACAPCMPEEGCPSETPCNTSPTAQAKKTKVKSQPSLSCRGAKSRRSKAQKECATVSKVHYRSNGAKETTMRAEEMDKFFALIGQGCPPCHPKMTAPEPSKVQEAQGIFEEEIKEGMERKEKLGLSSVMWSFLNHLVYGFCLGLFYRQRKI